MTAIVGLVQDGAVYIGGDSAGVSGLNLHVRADTKVFRRGRYLFGFTTSFRMGQLIHHSLAAPKPPAASPTTGEPGTAELDAFMATTFVDSLRTCLKAGGWARKESDREEGGTFLVGVRGQLYMVYDDYQVGRAADDFAAVGSGGEVALGALFATAGRGIKPKQRLTIALQAAERFNAGVRAPFVCLSLRR